MLPVRATSSLLGPLSRGRLMFLFAAFGIGACFVESPPPATFRFTCESDADCGEGEVCSAGLCQIPCGGELEPCPNDAPVCFNGYCSAVCPIADDVCPSPQECLNLSGVEDEPVTQGICAVPCSDTYPCPEGDLCFEGLCATPCTNDIDCDKGETCLADLGVCLISG